VVRSIGGTLGFIACCVMTSLAHAQPAAEEPAATTTTAAPAPAKPSEAPLPSCLDRTLRDELGADLKPRGVQVREFQKDGKVALTFHGGLFGGDLTSSSWVAGGALTVFPTEDFGIGGEFNLTPLELDLDEPLEMFFGDNRFEPGMAYIALGNLYWSPIHAKLKIGDSIIHSDLMVFAGGGRMFHDSIQGVAANAGFALDMFVTRVFTFRFDVRNLMTIAEVAGETRYTNNIIATAGFSFWIPVGL
jgi:outer membrane beta-barrel protein